MKSITKRIRRDYAPLTVSVSLVCTSGAAAALTQVYNATTGTYDPDHALSQLIVHPVVSAGANDGSWGTPNANTLLANMKWMVNGTDISTLTEWVGKYTIDTSTSATRGDIIISKNLTAGERVELSFSAEFADNRQGVNVPVYSDTVVMACQDYSEDGYELSLGETQVLQYDPFKDARYRYEYKVSHGLLAASSSAETAAKADVNSYERTVPIHLHKGGTEMAATDYTVKLYEMDASGTYTNEITVGKAGFDEVRAIAPEGVTLDLRMAAKRDYVVQAFITGRAAYVAQIQFSIQRLYPKFNVRPTNGMGIALTDTNRYDQVMAEAEGHILEVPESVLRILWYTDSATKTAVCHGEGATVYFALTATGLGVTYADDWLDVYTESEHKPVHCIAQDESGNTLTDESGNELIFN